jgi:hypothetical protein
VNEGEFRRLGAALRAYHRRFAPLFGRKEARRRSAQYLRGLLVQQTDRRNAENLAEAVEGASPRALQRFLTASPWPVEPVVAALQQYLGERLGPPAGSGEVAGDGVFVVDATAIPKQGTRSAGVDRQYCGALGKVANCQVGVFLGYATGPGHAVGRRQWLRCSGAVGPVLGASHRPWDLGGEGVLGDGHVDLDLEGDQVARRCLAAQQQSGRVVQRDLRALASLLTRRDRTPSLATQEGLWQFPADASVVEFDMKSLRLSSMHGAVIARAVERHSAVPGRPTQR